MSSEEQSRQRRTRDEIDSELEQLLADAEETAARLRRELEAKRSERAAAAAAQQAQLEIDQHAEIDRLEEHLAASRLRWAEVRGFLEEALREAGMGRHDHDANPGNGDNNGDGSDEDGPRADRPSQDR